MKVSITELEELRENLRKAWFYANKAAEIGEEGYIAEEILDEIQDAVGQLNYVNMAIDAEIDQEVGENTIKSRN